MLVAAFPPVVGTGAVAAPDFANKDGPVMGRGGSFVVAANGVV